MLAGTKRQQPTHAGHGGKSHAFTPCIPPFPDGALTADQAQAVQLAVGSLLGMVGVGVFTWAAKSVVAEIRTLVEKVARQDERINVLAVELGALRRWRDEFNAGLPAQVRQTVELELLRMAQTQGRDS